MVSRRARISAAAAFLACAVALAVPAAASTAPPSLPVPTPSLGSITEYLNVDAFGHCPVYGDLEICSGEVPSFDGSKLDVDLTLPPGARLRASAPRGDPGKPLIVMIHGAGGPDSSKHEFESTTDAANDGDRFEWNSHWFATHGFYVLTATQRGYRDDGTAYPWQPNTPSGTSVDVPNGTIRLSSGEFSPRDEQWLAARVAESFAVDTDHVAVTGRSSGGGETWQLASDNHWTFPHSVDRSLPVLHLRVAVPRTTWTDLAYSFAAHGHGGGPRGDDPYESAYGPPGSTAGLKGLFGAPKLSFAAAVYAGVANKQGVLEAGTSTTPSQEGRINLHAWFARVLAGDPDLSDPIAEQLRLGLTRFRSVYYWMPRWRRQPRHDRVAIFAIQGWTDDLFTAVEPFRQFKQLKRLDPSWPIAIGLGDLGNARAQNPPPVWRALNERAWRWVARWLPVRGVSPGPLEPPVVSYPTICRPDVMTAPPGTAIAASTPEGLATGRLSIGFPNGGTLTSASGIFDPDGPLSEPNVGVRINPCLKASGAGAAPYSATSPPLARTVAYVGLGTVTMRYRLTGSIASVHVRVWDVAPASDASGTLLVTRGTYTLLVPQFDAAAGTLRIPLFGNHWLLRAGHRLRVDVTQVDQPFFRPLNSPSSVSFDPPTLTLPTTP